MPLFDRDENESGFLARLRRRKEKPDKEEEALEVAELEKEPLEEKEERERIKEERERTKLEKLQEKALRAGKGISGAAGASVKRKGILYKIIIFLIIIIVLYLLWIFIISPLAGSFAGTYLAAGTEARIVGTEAGFMNIFRPAKGHLSNLLQTITVGPTQQWDAEELSSELIVNEDAEVSVRDLGAPMDFFVGDDITITGKLDAVGTFAGQRVILALGIDNKETDAELAYDWECELFGYEGKNIFKVSDMTSRRFTCTHPPLEEDALEDNPLRAFKVTFKLTHGTKAVISKNLFITDTVTVLAHEDPAEYFGIKPEETRGWLASDGKTIDLSMGLARVSKEDFIERIFKEENPADAFIPAVGESYSSVHDQYLGVAFRSKSYSDDIYIHNLTLELPADPAISVIESGSQFKKSGEPHLYNGQYPKLQDYVPEHPTRKIPAGVSEVIYLKFFVDDDYLGQEGNRVQYRTLTAQAAIDYDYIHKETITLKVKEKPT